MPESPPASATSPTEAAKQRRRRASRAAGPAAGTAEAAGTAVTARVELPAEAKPRTLRPPAPPPGRQPNRRLFGWLAAVSAVVVVAVLAGAVALLLVQRRDANAVADRDQQFIDTASQTVVNMFTYNQDNIDGSVNRFVDGTSGPLRDTLSQGSNVENLKAMFRDTNASSEAVVNGAALEGVKDQNGSVLVAVRVTVTDLDGVNKPSQAYRLRVIVHQDDNGRMTGYDLKYPDGGN
jgi:Mce-associated membrane protein